METFSFPPALWAASQSWRLDARARSGGETITGREPVVSSGLSRWMASITFPLYSRETINAHAALLARLEGRVNAVRLPFCPGPLGARVLPLLNGIPYAGRNLWLRPGLLPESLGIAPTVAVTAQAGATEIVINMGTLTGLEPGVLFGLGERIYIVTEMHGAAVSTVRFRPKLRFQIVAGTAVNWKGPRCIMRLQADDSGAADIQLRRTGTASMDFVEVW